MLPLSHILGGVNYSRASGAGNRGGDHHIIRAVVIPNEGIAELLSLALRVVVRLSNNKLILNYPLGKIRIARIGSVSKGTVLSAVVGVTVQVRL